MGVDGYHVLVNCQVFEYTGPPGGSNEGDAELFSAAAEWLRKNPDVAMFGVTFSQDTEVVAGEEQETTRLRIFFDR